MKKYCVIGSGRQGTASAYDFVKHGQPMSLKIIDSSQKNLDQCKNKILDPALPVLENLLSDREDHRIIREPKITDDNRYGFKLDTPEHKYNLGEIYNLSVIRGTLTQEERFKINDHIVQTIMMLEQLPFPKYLARVPEYAAGHHEKMNGSGYPRKLVKNQMSIPARIMAIADIFEALTAADRPYKSPKMLQIS